MTRTIVTYPVLLVSLFASSPASAQTDAERIQARVKPGQDVSIMDDQGREVTGEIRALGADALTMLVDGTTADVAYDRIVRIDRPNDGGGTTPAVVGWQPDGPDIGAALRAQL